MFPLDQLYTETPQGKKMKIKLINHASVIFDCGDVKILTDPWYTGSAFDNGWNLFVERDIDINSLDFNYLWYSHEHPDHFSIADLKKISDKKKQEISILFQVAPDQKVKKFCEANGFKVIEIPEDEDFFIGDVKLCCGKEGGFDSWISVTHKNKTALNINDCRLENEEELAPVKRLGNIDVLMTQFGWANWVGNKGDSDAREIARKMVYDKVDAQIENLSPNYIMPFASFCWFSHKDNISCNDEAITIKEFVNKYEQDNKIITLYLDDEWTVGQSMDCSEAVNKWQQQFDMDREPLHQSSTVHQQELQESFSFMVSKLKKDNDWARMAYIYRQFKGSVVRLEDVEKNYVFDITKNQLTITDEDYDIATSSECFNYLMRNAWGRGTLMINGRFQANYNTLHRFLRQTHVYYGNNIGRRFPEHISLDQIVNPKCFVFEMIQPEKK